MESENRDIAGRPTLTPSSVVRGEAISESCAQFALRAIGIET
eukprot:IDg11330t1